MKLYHKSKLVSRTGKVSPLCAKVPRALDLRKALWTIRDKAVTCPRCRRILAAAKGAR